MKGLNFNFKEYRYLIHGFLLFTFILAVQSCVTTHRTRIIVEHDTVKSSKRLKKEFYYRRALEKDSPFFSAKQTIIKEIKSDNEITYTVYDILSMSTSSYNLEDTMYLILGDEVIPINIDYQKTENSSRISEDTGSILAADSSKVSVVTGYTQYKWKNIQISYKLSSEIINKISNSDEVNLRYYSGPNMITIRMNYYDLKRLKKMIVMI